MSHLNRFIWLIKTSIKPQRENQSRFKAAHNIQVLLDSIPFDVEPVIMCESIRLKIVPTLRNEIEWRRAKRRVGTFDHIERLLFDENLILVKFIQSWKLDFFVCYEVELIWKTSRWVVYTFAAHNLSFYFIFVVRWILYKLIVDVFLCFFVDLITKRDEWQMFWLLDVAYLRNSYV